MLTCTPTGINNNQIISYSAPKPKFIPSQDFFSGKIHFQVYFCTHFQPGKDVSASDKGKQKQKINNECIFTIQTETEYR